MLSRHLTRWAATLRRLRPARWRRRQLRELAAGLEARALLLLPDAEEASGAGGRSLRQLLLSTAGLLDAAIDARAAEPAPHAAQEPSPAPDERLSGRGATLGSADAPDAAVEEPHGAVWELIGLRDWIAAARDEASDAPRAALAAVDRQIVRILAKQGITALDAHGTLDPALHDPVERRRTTESEKHNVIAATIRAGYAHGTKVLRRQQVIVFTSAQAPE